MWSVLRRSPPVPPRRRSSRPSVSPAGAWRQGPDGPIGHASVGPAPFTAGRRSYRAGGGRPFRPEGGLGRVYVIAGAAGSITELAENSGKVTTVGPAESFEGPFGLRSACQPNRVKDAGALLGYLDQGGPPIAGIGPPLDQAPRFEGIDDLGGRARSDVQMARKLRQAHRTVAHQHAQSAQLGWADVPGGQEVLGRLAQLACDGPESFCQRLVTARVAWVRRAAILGHRNRVPASPVVSSY